MRRHTMLIMLLGMCSHIFPCGHRLVEGGQLFFVQADTAALDELAHLTLAGEDVHAFLAHPGIKKRSTAVMPCSACVVQDGFEPPQTEPKPVVLPLHHWTISL